MIYVQKSKEQILTVITLEHRVTVVLLAQPRKASGCKTFSEKESAVRRGATSASWVRHQKNYNLEMTSKVKQIWTWFLQETKIEFVWLGVFCPLFCNTPGTDFFCTCWPLSDKRQTSQRVWLHKICSSRELGDSRQTCVKNCIGIITYVVFI